MGLIIGLIGMAVGAVRNANNNKILKQYNNTDEKIDYLTKIGSEKYLNKKYNFKRKEWTVDEVGAAVPDKDGNWGVHLFIKRGLYPFNDNIDVDVVDLISDETLNAILKEQEEENKDSMNILNKSKSI